MRGCGCVLGRREVLVTILDVHLGKLVVACAIGFAYRLKDVLAVLVDGLGDTYPIDIPHPDDLKGKSPTALSIGAELSSSLACEPSPYAIPMNKIFLMPQMVIALLSILILLWIGF